ncbi:MAG: ATP-dependent RecD-like DNA helicase [Firmicutes bacterium]|nr:ATP-dependent RecD-like DNA helicase [Bacillota bacterium]
MQIQGTISRVIFHNDGNGYTVAVFDTEDGAIRIAGAMNEPSAGKKFSLEGNFVVHQKYGEQFSFSSHKEMLPEGREAIREFLASGSIRGIGPKTADLIVETFGDDSLRIMEEDPDSLLQIKGIGPNSLAKIKESFGESREFARVSLELQELGLEMNDCVKVFKLYGVDSAAIVKENPYILVDDIRGINFIKADKIAARAGIEADSEFRIQSAIKHILRLWAVNGSTLMPESILVERVVELIDTSTESVLENITDMAFCGEIQTDTIDDIPVIYLYGYYQAEQRTAYNFKRLMSDYYNALPINIDNLIADAEASLSAERGGFQLSEKQRSAVRAALTNNVTVITGGPGTGKTTIIDTIVRCFERMDIKVALSAPTGRAAKRMEEATACPAMTVHRLLEYVFNEQTEEMYFGRNGDNPLEHNAIIVDEASMIDIMLMDGLLDAIPSGCRLILTGDADQLPSVGAGNVLRDIIRSEFIPVVRLKEIYRQAADSLIVTNAHMINEGEYPSTNDSPDRDFFIIHEDSENAILENIKSLVGGRLEAHYDFIDSAHDIQVLTPTKKGVLGAPNLNTVLQEVINPPADDKFELKLGGRLYREGDRVMQLKNNYGAEWKDVNTFMTGEGIFNGDIGIVTSIDSEAKTMLVEMDDKLVTYEGEMFDEVDLAYAITVHKSQGSEFPAVIIPMWSFPPMLMTRNLLYTGVTRGKQLVIIDGSEQKLQWMINNNRIDERYTGLRSRLVELDMNKW